MEFLRSMNQEVLDAMMENDRVSWVNSTYITDDTDGWLARRRRGRRSPVRLARDQAGAVRRPHCPPETKRKLTSCASAPPCPRRRRTARKARRIRDLPREHLRQGQVLPRGQARGRPGEPRSQTLVSKRPRREPQLRRAARGCGRAGTDRPADAATSTRATSSSANKGAREIGFDDLGALWRSGYDMTPADFEADDRAPLAAGASRSTTSCTATCARKLRPSTARTRCRRGGPIPAHLLGNMWAQEWGNIYDLVEPYPGEGRRSTSTKALVDAEVRRREDGEDSARASSPRSGCDRCPRRSGSARCSRSRATARSSATRARGTSTCDDDLRIKMCIEPTEEDLITIHHELGHDYYFRTTTSCRSSSSRAPTTASTRASATRSRCRDARLPEEARPPRRRCRQTQKADINVQMKMALDKVAFLPFGMLDRQVALGRLRGQDHARATTTRPGGSCARSTRASRRPAPRSEERLRSRARSTTSRRTCPTCATSSRASTSSSSTARSARRPGTRARSHSCSIYGNKEAGEKLQAMLALGASKPWPEALEVITGERADGRDRDPRLLRAADGLARRAEQGPDLRLVAPRVAGRPRV